MSVLKGRALLGCMGVMLFSARAAFAQERATHAAIKGEWTGTLALDAGPHAISLVFSAIDTSLVGRVLDGGQEFGPMEHITLARDTVHFSAGGLDFTGVVSGKHMKMALIVFSGSTRNFELTKQPDPPTPPSGPADATSAPPRSQRDRVIGDETRFAVQRDFHEILTPDQQIILPGLARQLFNARDKVRIRIFPRAG